MYVDTCILLKLLVPERDSAFWVEALEGQSLITSEVAVTELWSALLARERAGRLARVDRGRAWAEWEARLKAGEVRLGPVTSTVFRKARRILGQCHPEVGLRTLDAVHLATAELCQEFPLATTDGCMRGAAAKLGFELLPGAGEALEH